MKTTALLRRHRARDLLTLAEDFAAASMGGVICGLQEDPARPDRLYRSFTQLTVGLEVHFLFPNLSRIHQRVLTQLWEARNALVVRRQTRRGRGSAVGVTLGGRTGMWARRFKDLCKQAEALQVKAELTPVQREVLKNMLRQPQ